MTRNSRGFAEDSASTSPPAPNVMDLPREPSTTQLEGMPGLVQDQQQGEVQQHPLLIWTDLSPGDVVSLREAKTRQSVVGLVETRTRDGLIIWIRDDLNDRRAFHFNDCESVELLRKHDPDASPCSTPQTAFQPAARGPAPQSR